MSDYAKYRHNELHAERGVLMGNVQGLDQAISEVHARGFDIQIQIEKGGYFEFSISGKKLGQGHPFAVESGHGDIADGSIPMRIIETLMVMEGTL